MPVPLLSPLRCTCILSSGRSMLTLRQVPVRCLCPQLSHGGIPGCHHVRVVNVCSSQGKVLPNDGLQHPWCLYWVVYRASHLLLFCTSTTAYLPANVDEQHWCIWIHASSPVQLQRKCSLRRVALLQHHVCQLAPLLTPPAPDTSDFVLNIRQRFSTYNSLRLFFNC